MSIFSLSSVYNRFSRWAEKQPQIKLEKTLVEMARASTYGYESREDEFVAKVKGLIKDGAVIGAAELNRVLETENSKRYWNKPPFKVSRAMVAAGVLPDNDSYKLAAEGRADIFRDSLDGQGAVSAAALHYAIKCHGGETDLINALLDRGAKVSSAVLNVAIHHEYLPQDKQQDIVARIAAAGAKITENHVVNAIRCRRAEIALALIDAGAPVSALQLAYAVGYDNREVVEKLHKKGVSFDDAILACDNSEMQTKVKQYRKAITGEAYVDEAAFAALEAQVKTLTERLAKMEAANAPKPQGAAAKPK